MTVAATPVLLTRGQDGAVRAFVNMCSHRGAQVVEDGVGSSRRFACPYHAWTYDQQGSLVGILNREEFGEVDTSCLGLTSLPVEERAGLIFVVLTPGGWLDLDRFLCGYDSLLAHFEFEQWHLISRRAIAGPNWKVAYDGYLDLYHLPILHRNTFGPNTSNQAIYNVWGPHQRVSSPSHRTTARMVAEVPEAELAHRRPDRWGVDDLPPRFDRVLRGRRPGSAGVPAVSGRRCRQFGHDPELPARPRAQRRANGNWPTSRPTSSSTSCATRTTPPA